MASRKTAKRFLRIGATRRDLIEVPPDLFARLIADRLFDRHPKKSHVGVVNPRLSCWVEAVSSESMLPVECRLRFSLRVMPEIDRWALRSSFYMLTKLWTFTVRYVRQQGETQPQYVILWDWHRQVYQ